MKGKIFGITAGVFALYCCRSYLTYFERYFPTLRYLPLAKGIASLSTIVAFYKLGDYVFTSQRYGSNDHRFNGSLFSNRYYADNKAALM